MPNPMLAAKICDQFLVRVGAGPPVARSGIENRRAN